MLIMTGKNGNVSWQWMCIKSDEVNNNYIEVTLFTVISRRVDVGTHVLMLYILFESITGFYLQLRYVIYCGDNIFQLSKNVTGN